METRDPDQLRQIALYAGFLIVCLAVFILALKKML